ncbi:Com family DNA-binding transcriptional regulator [Rhodoferax sp.]|uniref:Com family DNA-binding transcriptional regulator n=1 Tax=Rhodoferax sp. TaxID=50421 RepID=UPI002ACD9F75|nr:Com family DNA-binding transcriptional regulator [Rhodoferax sp.]MDZ7920771.1 Com family DNA-binding transcriptional regulator [Rhodoferax sp.]
METIRCGQCQRKLAEAQYTRLEIKCPKCGTLNVLRASAADHSSPSPTPERPRASSKREPTDDDKKGR